MGQGSSTPDKESPHVDANCSTFFRKSLSRPRLDSGFWILDFVHSDYFSPNTMAGNSQTAASATQATSVSRFTLPLPYRLFFLLIEPLATLLGAFFAFFQQKTYLELTHASSAPSPIPLGTSIAMSQLANLYFAFALSEALVLRATSDLRVWKALLFCLLVADFGHLYTIRVLGPQIYWSVSEWNAIDWGNIGFVYVGASMRIAFLSGIRLASEGKPRKAA